MPGIYGVLNIGKGALLTQQKAIDVTGHNIANVNTPGYSRQRVNMETNTPIPFAPGQMGTGVNAVEIQRIYDSFLGVQINLNVAGQLANLRELSLWMPHTHDHPQYIQ